VVGLSQDAAPAKQLWIGEWQATKNIASGEPVTTSCLASQHLDVLNFDGVPARAFHPDGPCL